MTEPQGTWHNFPLKKCNFLPRNKALFRNCIPPNIFHLNSFYASLNPLHISFDGLVNSSVARRCKISCLAQGFDAHCRWL